MSDRRARALIAVLGILLLAGLPAPSVAQRTSDVRNTLHNLSTTGPGTTKSTNENQVCVFCHTPHGADTSETPLWNKTLAAKTYVVYTSKSLDAETILNTSLQQPLGSSKLCLSCHDGAMALGSVRVLRGVNNPANIPMTGAGAGDIMPPGSGITTGYTRNIGGGSLGQTTNFDLTNDHPISVTYNKALADSDGELRVPDAGQNSAQLIGGTHPLFGPRAAGQSANRPVLPLDPTGASAAGQVQCTTCHDPHLKGSAADITNEGNIKFLRRPRLQTGASGPTAAYTDGTDIICLACHDKGLQGLGGETWARSAHANSNVATQVYQNAAAATRQFPNAIPVWKVACLNCHDTHTVTGSRRLLREGTGATPVTSLDLGGFKAGGTSAIEETCFQCHTKATGGAQPVSILVTDTAKLVPDIRSDFQLTYHMPITSTDQDAGGVEMHDPGSGRPAFSDGNAGGVVNGATTSGNNCTTATNKCGADLVESKTLLGATVANRHVECTDCHNPHRVVKNRLFYGSVAGTYNITTPQTEGTHEHTDTAMTHTNVASGVLRGSWGVEPIYGSRSFHAVASNYTVRRGDPGSEVVATTMPLNQSGATVGGTVFNAMDTKGFVTREYQVCLKCHSSYVWGAGQPPNLRSAPSRGLTPAGTNLTPGSGNALTQYTDQAKEFQSPEIHADNSYDGNHDNTADYTAAALGVDGGANGGVAGAFDTNNHRAWHPVMRSTGRTTTKRGMGASTSGWRAPWSTAIGTQTMYCTDCHGSNVTSGTSVIPDNTVPGTGAGNPWGPHGSTNPFILKGRWDKDVTDGTAICMKCHNPVSGSTGFYDTSGRGRGNLHNYHQTKLSNGLKCTWCHVAVPHGWKNKMFLVNLNDVGEEAGQGAGTSREVAFSSQSDYYTQPPYYLGAKLKIRAFSPSGGWDWTNCGSANKTGANLISSTNGNTTNSNQNAANFMNSGGSPTCGKDAP
jgi:hypothetical protein